MTFLGACVSTKVNSVDFIIINHIRPIITDQGLWDQVSVDYGRKFCVTFFRATVAITISKKHGKGTILTNKVDSGRHVFCDC